MKLLQTYSPDYDYLCTFCGEPAPKGKACTPLHKLKLETISKAIEETKRIEKESGGIGRDWDLKTIRAWRAIQDTIS